MIIYQDDEEYVEEWCTRCGGGIDKDHPNLCSACLFEMHTGLNYERAVDAAHRFGVTLAEYVQRRKRIRLVVEGDL